MTPTDYAAHFASEVRAEMARQRKTQAGLAEALGITAHTAGRRLSGAVPFDVIEIVMVAEWLGVTPSALLPADEVIAS